MICFNRPHQLKSFKGCFPQILLGPFFDILPQIKIENNQYNQNISNERNNEKQITVTTYPIIYKKKDNFSFNKNNFQYFPSFFSLPTKRY